MARSPVSSHPSPNQFSGENETCCKGNLQENENHYERIRKIPTICFPNNKILTTVAHSCTLTPGPTPNLREQYRIPVQITPRIGQFLGRRSRSLGALRAILLSHDTSSQNINTNTEAGLKLLLSNTMSLAPKIDEIRCCILELKPDVACFTETWLHDSINVNHIYIPEYNFILKNRTTGIHGGVGLYIKNSIHFKSLAHLQVNNIEVLWTWLRPKRLPRGVPCIIIGTIYHPPQR